MNYQANRPLEQCPGYVAVVQVVTPAGQRLAAALRRDALELHTDRDIQYLFDLEGRFIRSGTRSEYRFRGCSHQGSISTKSESGLVREWISRSDLDRLCSEAWETASAFFQAFQEKDNITRAHPSEEEGRDAIGSIMSRVMSWPPDRLAGEAERFRQVYQPIPVLPPDHYSSLVLQATEGCTFNTCTFCKLYQDVPYRVKSAEEFDRHIGAALAFHGAGLYRLHNIFLGQANALAAPLPRLMELFERLAHHIELPDPNLPVKASWTSGEPLRFQGIGSFLDGFTGLRKSAEDYDRLRLLGLRRVYLGVESGSDRLLAWLRKPAQTSDMIKTMERLHQAGIRNDIILLVGPGGTQWAREHVTQTLEFLAAAPLERGDRIYLSDIYAYPETPYPRAMDAIDSRPLSLEEMNEQRDTLREGARELGLQAIPYRVEPFIY